MRVLLACILASGAAFAADSTGFNYQLLATTRISTMQREIDQSAADGFRFSSFISGETSFGGHEVVLVMSKPANGAPDSTAAYRLLAARNVASLQKRMEAAGADGFQYKATTVFHPGGGDMQVLVIMERDPGVAAKQYSYQLLATVRTSTMQKELQTAGLSGFKLLGVALANGVFGPEKVVAILGKEGL